MKRQRLRPEMYGISVTFCLLGLVATFVQAGDTVDCAGQYKDMLTCLMEIKDSADVKLVMDKKKQIMKEICIPDYPKTCIADWEAMLSCCKELSAKAKDDPETVTLMNKTGAEVNKCFLTQPQNPFSDLEEIFMPKLIKAMLLGKIFGKGKANNSASKESDEDSDEDSYLPTPPPDMQFRAECIPKPKEFKCVKSEMIKAYSSDANFKKSVQSIMKRKDECDSKIKRECDLSTPQLMKCFWGAHKDIFKTMFGKMMTCVKGKSGGGGGSSAGKGGEKKED